MNKEKFIKTSIGTFGLIKPKAGKRNRAVMMSESSQGIIKQATLIVHLLPLSINSRPEAVDKTVLIDDILNDLEIEDYDLLAEGLMDLLGETDTSEEKKTSSEDS